MSSTENENENVKVKVEGMYKLTQNDGDFFVRLGKWVRNMWLRIYNDGSVYACS